MEYKTAQARPLWKTRWWIRVREIAPPVNGWRTCQFYVPWWAWPLELAYCLIFGRVKLKKD